ncbi:MAG: putative Ig domain-containing protein, partial [Bryobacterales bacterium]|nr:putative Ig domain-containing protein [Bryobacterales bacterium]
MRIQAASTLFVCLYVASLQAQFAPLNIITPSPLPGAVAGTNYSVTIQATGGQPGYVFTISAGTVPPGLTLAPSGTLSGTPSQAGTFQFTVRVVDCNGVPAPNCVPGSATRIYTLAVAPGLTITNSFVEEGAVCQPYSQGMSASGGTQPYQWSATNLPPGLSISAGTGLISGTPSQQGQFTADIRVTDSAQRSVTRAYLFVIRQQVLRVVTTSLPAGAVGVSYVGNLTASGGARLNWTVAGGDMPPGLLLSTASTGVGVISGTPTTAGTFTATYRVTDAAGCIASASLPIAISGPSLRITTTTLNPARVGTAYSQAFTATGGSAPLTWSVTAGTLPQGLTLSSAGVLSGT